MNSNNQDADLCFAIKLLAAKPEAAARLDNHFGGPLTSITWLLTPDRDNVQPLHDLACSSSAFDRRLDSLGC